MHNSLQVYNAQSATTPWWAVLDRPIIVIDLAAPSYKFRSGRRQTTTSIFTRLWTLPCRPDNKQLGTSSMLSITHTATHVTHHTLVNRGHTIYKIYNANLASPLQLTATTCIASNPA